MPRHSQCLHSQRHPSLSLPACWVVWDFCPGVPFSKTKGGTRWRTLVDSHHRLYNSRAWQMSSSGPTVSSSSGCDRWCHQWAAGLADFLSAHPMSDSNHPNPPGLSRLIDSIVLQNWWGCDLPTAEREGLSLFLRQECGSALAHRI